MMTHTNSDVAPVSKQVLPQAQDEVPEFEVDTGDSTEFGTIYRLWQGWNLLGTFYYSAQYDKWVTQPSCSSRESPK